MKNKKLLIGASLITMLTTGAIGGVIPIQNASAHDISANQVSTQYTVTDTTQTNQEREVSTTVTQLKAQETTNKSSIFFEQRSCYLSSSIKSSRCNSRLYNASYKCIKICRNKLS